MTRRARDVEALLRGLLLTAPDPRTWTGELVARSGQPGEAAVKRENCPACEGLRRRRIRGVMQICADCEGTGYRWVDPVTGKRPLTVVDDDRSPSRQRAEAWEVRDAKLAQTERIIRQHDDLESAGDDFTTAVDRRDRLDELGAFRELRAALEWLRDLNPAAANIAITVGMYGVGVASSGSVRSTFEACCEVLASKMPDRIRVPGFLNAPIDPDARKQSLHRGRTPAHKKQLEERDRQILEALAGGETVNAIAERHRITPRWVRELRRRAIAPTVDDEASAEVGPTGQDPARPEPAEPGGFPRFQGGPA